MTWIILQFVFLAMPVVLPALLYRSRRYFMAKFYDKIDMERKGPQVVHPCAAYRIAPLPLCLYERTPRRVRCCAIHHCVCRMGLFPAGGPMDALFARPAETFRLVCALGIGHRLRAASVHDVRNHRLYSFGCPVLPVGKGHVRKDRHAQIPRMAGISRSISRQLS